MLKKGIAAFGVVLLFAACSKKSDFASGKTLAKVNGYEITEGDLSGLAKTNPRASLYFATPSNKQQVVNDLIDKELLYQSALKERLDKKPDIKAEINYSTKEILGKARLDAAVEQAAKQYYDAHRDEFEQVHLAYIFISPQGRKKDEPLKMAQDIKARLGKGEDFMKIAGAMAANSAGKDRGGDLGFVSRQERDVERRKLTPVLAKALTMQKGEISEPIITDDGVYLIMIVESPTLKPFDEVSGSIGFRMREDVRKELLKSLREKAKVVEYNAKDEK